MQQAQPGVTSVEVCSPMQGWLWPLARVPDAAFAQGALGPGVAIDPLNPLVTAPLAGTVVTFNPSHHAIVIRHDCGIEVLVHVGIDTVELGGKGFVARAALGQRVEAGDPLLECDLDVVAGRGLSLASPVVVVAPDGVTLRPLALEGEIARGAPLFVAEFHAESAPIAPVQGERAEEVLTIGLPHGVHARPAAALARLLRTGGLAGELIVGERRADLASTVALMRGGFAAGDNATVRITGLGAQRALDEVAAILRGQFAEAEAHQGVPQSAPVAPAPKGQLRGLPGSRGLAVGPAFHHQPPRFDVAETGVGLATEQAALARALAAVAQEFDRADSQGALGEVLAAHRELLADPELRRLAEAGIALGQSAGHAWRSACETVADLFARSDARLAERRADLADLARRVLAQLSGKPGALPAAPAGCVVLADDLLPSDLAHYAGCGVAGAALAGSSPTAHVAIIAAGLSLPILTALGQGLEAIAEGQDVLLDADAGLLDPAPGRDRIAAAKDRIAALAVQAEADRAAAGQLARTRDDVEIAVMANLGGLDDALAAVAAGADGCGLLRTEFLFLERESAPDEAEQAAAYGAIRAALGARPLTIRTLDIGGDKPVRFLPGRHEDNPALGLRGLRVSLAHPGLLDAQLEAVLRVADAGNGAPIRLMAPMVSGLEEWRALRAAAERLGAGRALTLGLMVETPAAVLLADQFASEADFLSIGSNDLTQYVLAMDRTNPDLASAADPLHPAVLRAIGLVCAHAAPHGCPVSVCGALAGDPLGIPLLLGLGVSSLSVVPAAVPVTKRIVRECHRGEWTALALEACNLPTPAAVRAFVQSRQPQGEKRA